MLNKIIFIVIMYIIIIVTNKVHNAITLPEFQLLHVAETGMTPHTYRKRCENNVVEPNVAETGIHP